MNDLLTGQKLTKVSGYQLTMDKAQNSLGLLDCNSNAALEISAMKHHVSDVQGRVIYQMRELASDEIYARLLKKSC